MGTNRTLSQVYLVRIIFLLSLRNVRPFEWVSDCVLVQELNHYNLTLKNSTDWTCLSHSQSLRNGNGNYSFDGPGVPEVGNIIIGVSRFLDRKIRCENRRDLTKKSPSHCTINCDKFMHGEISQSECAKRIFDDIGYGKWKEWNYDRKRRVIRNSTNLAKLEYKLGGSNESNACNCTIVQKQANRTELDKISLEFGRVISRVINIDKNISANAQHETEENFRISQACSESIASLRTELQELKKEITLLRDNLNKSGVNNNPPNIDLRELVKKKVELIFSQH